MAVIVADTDVLIDFLAGRAPAATVVAKAIERNELVTTTITRFEILSGARTPDERAKISEFVGSLRSLPLDSAAADRAADVYQSLAARGQKLEAGDCLIAGIVMQHGASLLTRNRKHFERIANLVLNDL